MAVVAGEKEGLVPHPSGEDELPDGSKAIRAHSWDEIGEIIERFEKLKSYNSVMVPGDPSHG